MDHINTAKDKGVFGEESAMSDKKIKELGSKGLLNIFSYRIILND